MAKSGVTCILSTYPEADQGRSPDFVRILLLLAAALRARLAVVFAKVGGSCKKGSLEW